MNSNQKMKCVVVQLLGNTGYDLILDNQSMSKILVVAKWANNSIIILRRKKNIENYISEVYILQ